MAESLKAISIKQPWANLIVDGGKTIETRTWATTYRGRILIVSSKAPKIEPAGFALATADLVACRPMTKNDEGAAKCELYPKAYSWVLESVVAIEPFPVKGHLGLYDVTLSEGMIRPRASNPDRTLFD